ncbi:MAG: sulfate permease [Gammaproteobacteria bacterium]|nr:sulfate permease [Gammaproteobacteria bacterium]
MAWIGDLKKPGVMRADIIAGITVALVLVPQSMAYAQLAGLPAYYGLYASFLPGIIAALFGSSRQLATGPVAVVSLMTASALEPIAGANQELYIAYAIMLALMVGIFQLGLGLLRLGILVNFLSHPVVVGFTNAAAIIIGTSQLGKLFGVSVEKAEHTYETVFNTLVEAARNTHTETLLMAILALAIMIVLKRFLPKVPNVLTAVAITTVISWRIGFEAMGGKVVGAIPAGLPPLAMPTIDFQVMTELLTVAVVISIIGFMEAISIAKAMATRTRQRLDANQELVGQGLGNILSSFSGGYAVSGSFSRSAVNISSGAVTGFSAVITGVVVGITLIALTPLLYHLPQATLAAVIIMAVINLVKIDPIRHAWKVQRHDAVVAVITFVLTLAWAPHLEQGIKIGVILSLALFLYRTMSPRVAVLSRDPDGTLRDAEVRKLQTCRNISLIRFDGPLYFANTGYFEDKVLERVALKPDLKFVIIDAEGINEIDATGEEMLFNLVDRLKEAGIELIIARAKKQLWDTFERTDLMDRLGRDHVFALRTQAFNYAWDRLGDNHAETCPLRVPHPIEQT